MQTVHVPRNSLVTKYHTITDEESGVFSAYRSLKIALHRPPSRVRDLLSRAIYACTHER
jgi:hypothetical protein